ncbi:hypothetical protein DEI99_008120 [Curtobacterium sp. MCLR17_036]|uniref:hypothetical protein n=1 Tax=Curtobacterium sp. MCLR17_036 TaxID=2175620 RepID=UPI0015E87BE9|nr:hypothetical protein [Curtobacterium sp. MCLR17_036]WIE66488.1 hypothetical protein DEI99_008120 [Curtobacterium sp. MCLR17_036]
MAAARAPSSIAVEAADVRRWYRATRGVLVLGRAGSTAVLGAPDAQWATDR